MTRGRARRYVLTKQGYYPGVVASMGYDVWDWSTLNAGTLFQDSAKTTPASANGDVIGCWTDGVGGVDATQVTTANKPGLALNSLNGLPTLSFDGGDLLATGNISISTFAIWAVYKRSNNPVIYEQSTNAFITNGFFLSSSSVPGNYLVRRNGLEDRYTWIDSLTDWRINRHESPTTHAAHKLYQNNVEVVGTPVSTNNPGDTPATDKLYIGGRSASLFLTGNIAHICIISPYPTDVAIIANMESYINGLWGVY